MPTDAATTGGLIALAAVVLGTLLAAFVGGKVGNRYHRKVDRVGRSALPTPAVRAAGGSAQGTESDPGLFQRRPHGSGRLDGTR